jgi:phosphoglycolate phosphatase
VAAAADPAASVAAVPDDAPLACFDLDGTLVDSRGPFAAALRGALAEHGLPDRPAEELHRFLGPPFEETAATILGDAGHDADEATVEALLTTYRARYARDGIPATTAVAGIPEALDALRADGWRLVVVTSKMRPFATSVVEHLGLADRFEGIHGPEPHERHVAKATTLAAVLEAAGPRPAVMIGDRHHDLDAATAVGIPGVGVTWAGDHADELREAGAVSVLGDPAELPTALRAAIAV